MLTVTSKFQLNELKQKQNRLEFEQIVNSNYINMYADMVGALEYQAEKAGYSKDDIEGSTEYKVLIASEEYFEDRNHAIDTELDVLDDEIKNFNSLHQNSVKGDTEFWCFGG